MRDIPASLTQLRTTSEALATDWSKGRITVPQAVRRRLGLREHDRMLFTFADDGDVTFRPLKFPT